MLPSHMEPSVCPSAGRVGVCYNWHDEDILGKERAGVGISVTWGLFVIKGHPWQNDPSVVSSFTSGWGGGDRLRTGTAPTTHWCHWECHPLVSLLVKTPVGRKKCFPPLGCNYPVPDNPEVDIRISSPCAAEHGDVTPPGWTNREFGKSQNWVFLGKTERNRENTRPDDNWVSPLWENCPLGKRTRCGVL